MGVPPAPDDHPVLTAYVRAMIRFKARQLARTRGFSRSDEDDLDQELTTAVLRKAHLYDPARGASVATFAHTVVESAAGMIVRARRRLKRAAGFAAMSLDTGTVEVHGRPVPIAAIVGDIDLRTGRSEPQPPEALREQDEAIAQALADLTPHLAEVAEGLKDTSVARLAKQLGTSRRQVYAAILLLRHRFKAAGLGPDEKT